MTVGERLIQRGIELGERAVLLRLLRKRFGSQVDAETEQHIETASAEQFDLWGRPLVHRDVARGAPGRLKTSAPAARSCLVRQMAALTTARG